MGLCRLPGQIAMMKTRTLISSVETNAHAAPRHLTMQEWPEELRLLLRAQT